LWIRIQVKIIRIRNTVAIVALLADGAENLARVLQEKPQKMSYANMAALWGQPSTAYIGLTWRFLPLSGHWHKER
jgi:hypothetical protein